MQLSSLSERILGNPIDRIRVADVGARDWQSTHSSDIQVPYRHLNLRSNVAPVDVRVPVYSIHGGVVAERFVQASFPVIE